MPISKYETEKYTYVVVSEGFHFPVERIEFSSIPRRDKTFVTVMFRKVIGLSGKTSYLLG